MVLIKKKCRHGRPRLQARTAPIISHQLYIAAEQKIVLWDLLFYMLNKLQSTAHDDIVKTWAEFYDDAYIWEEKEKFFLAIGKKHIKSRAADKKIKDLNDKLAEMSARDIGADFQPTWRRWRLRFSAGG